MSSHSLEVCHACKNSAVEKSTQGRCLIQEFQYLHLYIKRPHVQGLSLSSLFSFSFKAVETSPISVEKIWQIVVDDKWVVGVNIVNRCDW